MTPLNAQRRWHTGTSHDRISTRAGISTRTVADTRAGIRSRTRIRVTLTSCSGSATLSGTVLCGRAA